MKGLIGKKVGMTQVFDETGVVTPVTIIQAGPCFVTQVKDEKNDGYSAIQIGFGEVSAKRLTRGEQGHLGIVKGNKKSGRRGGDKGIPAVAVGVTIGERHHKLDEIDEFASIEPMAAGLAQLAGLLMVMDGEGRDEPATVA